MYFRMSLISVPMEIDNLFIVLKFIQNFEKLQKTVKTFFVQINKSYTDEITVKEAST